MLEPSGAGRRPSRAARGGGLADEDRRDAAAQEDHSHHAEQHAPREDRGDRPEPVAGEDERGPVARVPQRRPGAQKAQLGEAQRLCLWLPTVQIEVQLRHEVTRRLVRHAPECGHRGARPGGEERAAERVRALAADELAALGLAGGKGGEVDPAQVEVVDFLQEQIVRPVLLAVR